MAIPLWTGKVGPGSDKPWMPTVETLAPYKAYAEGARLAKDLPSTGQAIVEGIQGAIDKNQAYRAKEAEIARVQAVTQAAEAEAKVRADQYAEAVRLQDQEQKLMQVMQTGTPEQKSEAFWSGQFVDIFGANPKLQESIFKTVIAPTLDTPSLHRYLGKQLDARDADRIRNQTYKLSEEEIKADSSLKTNQFVQSIINDKGLGFETPNEAYVAITYAQPKPFNAYVTDQFGNIEYETVNGKQTPKLRTDLTEGLPAGYGENAAKDYYTLDVGGKAFHVLKKDLDSAKTAIATKLNVQQRMLLNDERDSLLNTTTRIADARSRVAAGIGQQQPTQQSTQQPTQQQQTGATPAQQLQINEPERKINITVNTPINQETIKGSGVVKVGQTEVDRAELETFASGTLGLTDEQQKRYGARLASIIEAGVAVPNLLYTDTWFNGQQVRREIAIINTGKTTSVVKDVGPAAGLIDIAQQIARENYQKEIKVREEEKGKTIAALEKSKDKLKVAGISTNYAVVEAPTIMSENRYIKAETDRILERVGVIIKQTSDSLRSNSPIAIDQSKASLSSNLKQLSDQTRGMPK